MTAFPLLDFSFKDFELSVPDRVVLCEGPTEVDVLERWWETELEEDEFALVSVGGHKSFASWIDLVRGMGLPWAVLCDGPALRPGTGPVAKLLGLSATDDFGEARAAAEKAGAFTFADRFGDDGTKTGEIEEFLRQVDATAFAEIIGDRSGKARVGRAFAARVPRPPGPNRFTRLSASVSTIPRKFSGMSSRAGTASQAPEGN